MAKFAAPATSVMASKPMLARVAEPAVMGARAPAKKVAKKPVKKAVKKAVKKVSPVASASHLILSPR